MLVMRANLRLLLCVFIVVSSAAYAVLVIENPPIAAAVSSGYVALLATIFILVNLWKRP